MPAPEIPPAQGPRRAAAVGVLALLAWGTARSLWVDWDQMRHWSAAWHRRAFTASPAERIRSALGEEDWEVWRALEEHVPADVRVVVSYDAGDRGQRLFERLQHLRVLRSPIGIHGVPYRRGVREVVPRLDDAYLLDLDSGRDLAALAAAEQLVRGTDFTLLAVRRAPR
jgi:hypothetical protein